MDPHDLWGLQGDVDPYGGRDVDFDNEGSDTIPCVPPDWELDPDD
jgi:hypothetical protein